MTQSTQKDGVEPPDPDRPVPQLDGIVINRLLGQGGMGIVYKGLHTRLCIPVAVKVLGARRPTADSQMMNEARLAAKVNHPNVARVYDVNLQKDAMYIVQEFVDGESVADMIDRCAAQKVWLDEARVLELAADAARGLSAIHREGILHLDIKPDNIIVQKRDGVAKIVDLGLAKRNEPRVLKEDDGKPGSVYGTPGFMSPEQIQDMELDTTTDLYSLGSTIYEMLTNLPAFPGGARDLLAIFQMQTHGEPPDPSTIRAGLSPATVAIVRACLQCDPASRPASAKELLERLIDARRALDKSPVPEPKTAPSPLLHAEKPATVVCVDDDIALCEFVAEALSTAGHKVHTFNSGAPALQHLVVHSADLVLLDMEMPGANGLKVCNAIRALPNCMDVPIVFMSGVSDLHTIDMAIKTGATDYLIKPVIMADLLTRVQCLTRLCQVQRERSALEAQYKKMSTRTSVILQRGGKSEGSGK